MAYRDYYDFVLNFSTEDFEIDTCYVGDRDELRSSSSGRSSAPTELQNEPRPYETAILSGRYSSDGDWIIVEEYENREQALVGHDKWVMKMTKSKLPRKLINVSTIKEAQDADSKEGTGWRTYILKPE